MTRTRALVPLAAALLLAALPVHAQIDDGAVVEDPNATRLFFGPTARALEAGEGYFAAYQLIFPFVGYGLTDRVTLAAGTPIVPGWIGRVFYFAPKVEVARSEGFSAAVGALAFFATEAFDGSAGIAYGVGTFGVPDAALSLGVGFPFVATFDDSWVGNDPIVMVGGEYRTSARTKLLTENYVTTAGEVGLGSLGVRFMGERLSADFGVLLGPWDDSNLRCCLPLVNFVYTFGGR